jgi:hypothetical protein
LILLRFEFANEFRPRKPNEGPPAEAPTRALTLIRCEPSAAFRPREVTPNRGNNVASARRKKSAWFLQLGPKTAFRTGRIEAQPQNATAFWRRRSTTGPNRQSRKANLTQRRFVICVG